MPAAAVIPAPVAYIKVVAVKKLVVGFLTNRSGPFSFTGNECRFEFVILPESCVYRLLGRTLAIWIYYFEKIRVFKAGLCYEYISME